MLGCFTEMEELLEDMQVDNALDLTVNNIDTNTGNAGKCCRPDLTRLDKT
jgi:hypothetical protein